MSSVRLVKEFYVFDFDLVGVADLAEAYEARGYSHRDAVFAQKVANALASFMGALNTVKRFTRGFQVGSLIFLLIL